MIVGDLFSGIGGFSLAAHWMGWRTAWFSEIDPYASRVLAHHWPDVPNLGDITKINWDTYDHAVDILCGGFPCQDISNIGKRAGMEGQRSGLWFEYARVIRELRPRYVVVENVAALTNRGLDVVLGTLADIGYDAEWRVLSAADVGAPHYRNRLWITAHRPFQYAHECESCPCGCDEPWCARHGDHYADCLCIGPHSELVADTFGTGLERHAGDENDTRKGQEQSRSISSRGLRTGGNPAEKWNAEPDVPRVAYGIPFRVDRLRCIGNAIVPQCALEIFRDIEQHNACNT